MQMYIRFLQSNIVELTALYIVVIMLKKCRWDILVPIGAKMNLKL